jgi:hypothetical protein
MAAMMASHTGVTLSLLKFRLTIPRSFVHRNARDCKRFRCASAFGVMASSFTSVAPAALSGLFPTRVRATGVSIVYNAAIIAIPFLRGAASAALSEPLEAPIREV